MLSKNLDFLRSSMRNCKNVPLKNLLLSFEFPAPQPTSLQTASTDNCSSLPYHNLVPPQPRVISLHAHSVAVAIHSFLYNISHTPRERFPMHSHAVVMERQPSQKETANKANLTSRSGSVHTGVVT